MSIVEFFAGFMHFYYTSVTQLFHFAWALAWNVTPSCKACVLKNYYKLYYILHCTLKKC